MKLTSRRNGRRCSASAGDGRRPHADPCAGCAPLTASRCADDILFDYSKNRITERTMAC